MEWQLTKENISLQGKTYQNTTLSTRNYTKYPASEPGPSKRYAVDQPLKQRYGLKRSCAKRQPLWKTKRDVLGLHITGYSPPLGCHVLLCKQSKKVKMQSFSKITSCLWNPVYHHLFLPSLLPPPLHVRFFSYPLSYGVPIRERYGSTLLPATREQHDQNCTQSH